MYPHPAPPSPVPSPAPPPPAPREASASVSTVTGSVSTVTGSASTVTGIEAELHRMRNENEDLKKNLEEVRRAGERARKDPERKRLDQEMMRFKVDSVRKKGDADELKLEICTLKKTLQVSEEQLNNEFANLEETIGQIGTLKKELINLEMDFMEATKQGGGEEVIELEADSLNKARQEPDGQCRELSVEKEDPLGRLETIKRELNALKEQFTSLQAKISNSLQSPAVPVEKDMKVTSLPNWVAASTGAVAAAAILISIFILFRN